MSMQAKLGWIILLGLGELADLVTTRVGMAAGTREANPFAAMLMSHGLFEVVKLAPIVVMAIVMWRLFSLRKDHDSSLRLVRAWALRGTQLGAISLAGTATLNLGTIALQAILT
jgi:hypothetical protein